MDKRLIFFSYKKNVKKMIPSLSVNYKKKGKNYAQIQKQYLILFFTITIVAEESSFLCEKISATISSLTFDCLTLQNAILLIIMSGAWLNYQQRKLRAIPKMN